MAPLNERIEAEIENIERALSQLPNSAKCGELSTLELAGVAAFLHNFYNGVENIIKQIMISDNTKVPTGPSWHRDLITRALERNIITGNTAKDLQRYLAFRHFFSHAYALDLKADYVKPLAKDAQSVFTKLKTGIQKYLR